MKEIQDKHVIELFLEVIKIQKDYAHEQAGAESDRRAKMKKAVNVIATQIEKGADNGN